MAKSIRSKAKRKLRAAKREKVVAKQKLKLLSIQEQEEGIKMSQDAVESGEKDEIIPTFSGDGDEVMDVVSEDQSGGKAKKKLKKTSKSVNGKNIKRLKKKRKNKYKW